MNVEFNIKELATLVNSENTSGLVTFLNPYTYLHARKNWHLYSQFDKVEIDGMALVLFLRFFMGLDVERKSFDSTSEANRVFESSEADSGSIYIVGSTDEHVDKAVSVLKHNYPKANFAGYCSGYFDDEQARIKKINEIVGLQPTTVICGMGGVLQEQFLIDLRQAGWKGCGYTCGGYLHQISMFGYNYYPEWTDDLNLRWLYRIIKEPNVRKRYFIDYPVFVVKFLKDVLWAR